MTNPDTEGQRQPRKETTSTCLRRDTERLGEYSRIIEDHLEQGIIEKVDETEEQPVGQTHYLLHQAVIRQDALTMKLRVVFDASVC